MNWATALFIFNGGQKDHILLSAAAKFSRNHSKTTIYDRYGHIIDEIPQQDTVLLMSWHHSGDVLATSTSINTTVIFWEVGSRRTETIDMNPGTKDAVTFMQWSPVDKVLAAGTGKGCLILYNRQSAKRTVFPRKHQHPINCGAFSQNGKLGLGSEDGIVTVSDQNGTTIHTVSCCSEPSLLKFYNFKQLNDKNVRSEEMLSTVLGGVILMIMDMNDYQKPINLQFQSRYGEIVTYSWYGNGYILLGFAKGYIVCISAHTSEIGQEMFSVQDFKNSIGSLCISETLSQVMIVGDFQLKVRDIGQLEEVLAMYDIESEDKGLHQVEATEDGQMIAVAGLSGTINVFLTKMPTIGAGYKNSVAILSSLTEVTTYNESKIASSAKVDVGIEPSFIAVGVKHFAIAMNNRVWIYEIGADSQLVSELQFLCSVNGIVMNEQYLAAKLNGVVQLHKLLSDDGKYNTEISGRTFPDPQTCAAMIQDFALTDDFFIYCTDAGHLHYYSLDYDACVNQFKHSAGIQKVFPDPNSVRLCLFDVRFDGYIYSPVDDALHKLPSTESAAHYDYCMWENFCADKNVFAVCYKNILQVFLFSPIHINGKFIDP
uniref:WD repeat-containing protein 19 n=1 Tax=Syphacia muris TaxID=451379 RepID=A0A0N5AR89_9BILA